MATMTSQNALLTYFVLPLSLLYSNRSLHGSLFIVVAVCKITERIKRGRSWWFISASMSTVLSQKHASTKNKTQTNKQTNKQKQCYLTSVVSLMWNSFTFLFGSPWLSPVQNNDIFFHVQWICKIPLKRLIVVFQLQSFFTSFCHVWASYPHSILCMTISLFPCTWALLLLGKVFSKKYVESKKMRTIMSVITYFHLMFQ